MWLILAAALWLAVGSLAIAVRRHHRDQLTYDYRLPEPKGFAGLGASIGRTFEAMTWGSSLQTWRARCEASLAASRRRRGLR